MGSREKILSAVLKNQPAEIPLPVLESNHIETDKHADEFVAVLERIGGKVIEIENYAPLIKYVETNFGVERRIVSTIAQLPWYTTTLSQQPPQTYENVDLAILKGHFGVAENGAIWITDMLMGDRSIPFISHHLSLVINKKDIVPTLHEAYNLIEPNYNFGTFIAGPSKTADIEQSLVLGAHGPKSLVVFLLTD